MPLGRRNLNLSTQKHDSANVDEQIIEEKPSTSKRTTRSRDNVNNNRKITEYFTVLSRGRDIPKSPQIPRIANIRSPSIYPLRETPVSTNRLPQINHNVHRPEANIIEFVNSSNLDMGAKPSKIPLHENLKPDFEVFDRFVTEHNRLFDSVDCSDQNSTPDPDIEIVDILPPIQFRDHPIVDID